MFSFVFVYSAQNKNASLYNKKNTIKSLVKQKLFFKYVILRI